MKRITNLVFFVSLFFTGAAGQQWYKGDVTLLGSETESIALLRQRAIQQARINALQQAGISLQSTQIRLQGETNNTVFDMYGAFAQSNTRGVIVKERNATESITFVTMSGVSVPQMAISLEAFIEVPKGEIDPTFEVAIGTNKKTYYDGEDLHMTIQSSKNGFLSLFQIKNDTCFILYPHPQLPVTYNNTITAKNKIAIPPKSSPYSYELNLEGGNGKQDIEFIVAVVTKEDIRPGGSFNRKEFFSLQEYNSWLLSVPIDQRGSASAIITIVKK